MNIPPSLLKRLQETLQRLFIKKPAYFKYWSIASNVLMLLSGLPYVIQGAAWAFNFDIPGIVDILSNKLLLGVGFGLKLMAMLTVHTPPVAQTEEGSAVTVIDPKKMPFTKAAEEKEMDKTVPPPPVVTEVPEVVPDDKKD